MIRQFDVPLPCRDEITRGLVTFVKTKKLPLSLCFATQILLDVHHGLRCTPNKAFNDLKLFSLRVSKSIGNYQNFSKSFTGRATFWPQNSEDFITALKENVEAWTADDPFFKF